MLTLLLLGATAGTPPSEHEFFEREIRPVLIERCYRCHNSVDERRGGLALDHAAGLLEGGDSGPAIVPGDPDASLLMRAVRHEDGVRPMPEDEPVLEPHELAAFEDWILSGAPDPRDTPPTAEALAEETSWERIRERRLAWWSFQPVKAPPAPEVAREDWSLDDMDRFVLARLEAKGEAPAEDIPPAALLRRASFALTGLPPAAEELEAFLADPSRDAYERAVDRLLESPHYGERMARRWMDLFRYADSHGSEGDPNIPQAWRYRDYLIRAFEDDVAWNRLVEEHVAGDLLDPRIDEESGLNEAMMGLGHFRFVQHGYAPTEPLVDQVQFVDNQVDVVTKAVLGLTVSCARCHDHKFDPISQKDYFGLYGVLASGRAAVRTADSEELRRRNTMELAELKGRIRDGLAARWRSSIADLAVAMQENEAALEEARKALKENRPHALAPWVHALDGGEVEADWIQRLEGQAEVEESSQAASWHLGGPDARSWHAHGSVLEPEPAAPGEFSVLPEGARVLETLLPGGVYSHLLSNRHSAVLSSPAFHVPGGSLWIRAMGGGGARARYAMQLHPRVSGPTYRATGLGGATPRWMRWDMEYWEGDSAHIELATARDIPIEARGDERSWWGITDARVVPAGQPAPRDLPSEFLSPLFEGASPPRNQAELLGQYLVAVDTAIVRWSNGECSDADVRFLDPFVRFGLLPTELQDLGELDGVVQEYRRLEGEIAVPTRTPGVATGDLIHQPLFERGDPQRPGEPVPQRFLEFLDDEPYAGDGRLALARDLVREDNPLPARVAANRMWTWVFGEGIVSSVDNFGLLGTEPSNPELLDHLATRLVEQGWSTKAFMRALVTSRTFRQSGPARRLDAESVRDALLAVSGRLRTDRFGPSVGERDTRRSIYVTQRRTSMPALLAAFDQPPPNTTVGRRNVTNVPAQSLALLNDPLAEACAEEWARASMDSEGEADARIRSMFRRAFSREPDQEEIRRAMSFLDEARSLFESAREDARALEETIANADRRLAELDEIGRVRVLESRGLGDEPQEAPSLEPVALWEFEGNLEDELGALHGESFGEVRIEDGRLALDGRGHVRTRPLEADLRVKTLEAWVELTKADQEGAGIVGVQNNDGGVFDTLVFAEREPLRWIAGSDTFNRTRDVDGPEEEIGTLVHMVVTYDDAGKITLYRDGVPYGGAYDSSGPVTFAKGNAHVILGARHGSAGSPRGPLVGAIERAALYDRVLTPEEIAASSAGDPDFVTRGERREALSEAELQELSDLERTRDGARVRREELQPALDGGEGRPWRELAHALFLMEEFRYLR